MKTTKLAINPNLSFVLLKHRSLILGALLRGGKDFVEARKITDELIVALKERLRFGFPRDVSLWLIRYFYKNWPGTTDSLIFSSNDTLALLFAVSHPALTPRSRSLLCLHLLGGLPNNRMVPSGQSPQKWLERLGRANRALRYSLSSDVLSYDFRSRNRDPIILDTLYRSILFCDAHNLCALREYLGSLFFLIKPFLQEPSESTAFEAWSIMTESRRYARLFQRGLQVEDRSRWDQGLIRKGKELLHEAQNLSHSWGPFCLRASILSLHLESPSYKQSNWADILRLELLLLQFDQGTEQLLSYIEALRESEGPKKALPYFKMKDQLDYRWVFAHAQLLKQMGRKQEALQLYQHALKCAPERVRSQILYDMADL